MAYDEKLADRVRRSLTPHTRFDERAMFGGLAFMVRGHMCCGLVKDRLMVRVDPDDYERWLEQPGAAPMDFTGRPMRGFLYVGGPGIATAPALNAWIGRALAFVERRPQKTAGATKAGAKVARKAPTARSTAGARLTRRR